MIKPTYSNKAICTLIYGAKAQELSRLSLDRMREYAEKVNASLVIWDECGDYVVPHFAKFDLLKHMIDYDHILYLDIDVLISQDAPNIFKSYKTALWPHTGIITTRQVRILNVVFDTDLNESAPYYNTGVMVFSKNDLVHVTKLLGRPCVCPDCEQAQLNYAIHKSGITVEEMDILWNYNRVARGRRKAYFYHYLNIKHEERMRAMKEDL